MGGRGCVATSQVRNTLFIVKSICRNHWTREIISLFVTKQITIGGLGESTGNQIIIIII